MRLDDAAELLADADVVISTLPWGAADQLAHLPWRRSTTVFDVIYDPWPTPLAEAVLAQQGRVVSGLDLVLHQAGPPDSTDDWSAGAPRRDEVRIGGEPPRHTPGKHLMPIGFAIAIAAMRSGRWMGADDRHVARAASGAAVAWLFALRAVSASIGGPRSDSGVVVGLFARTLPAMRFRHWLAISAGGG